MSRPQILCVMCLPPDPDGHGASQRAWHSLQALLPHGRVHFVLVYCDQHLDCMTTSLAPVERLAASVTRIEIQAWRGARGRLFGVLHEDWSNLARMGSQMAPRFGAATLRSIVDRLPVREADLVFAGRLCSAMIVDQLIERGMLSVRGPRLVDFDDVASVFLARQLAQEGSVWGRQGRMLAGIETRVIAAAEGRIARSWRNLAVCSDEDAALLRHRFPTSAVTRIPNIVTRPEFPPRVPDGRFRLLFVGNLRFPPNAHGLSAFLAGAWPALREAVPEAALGVVGLDPSAELLATAARLGLAVHANVPDVAPYYEGCDVVIAPILFGSGTRIKIIEAMAFGRPVVATRLAAEGLGCADGDQMVLTDTVAEFVPALAALARDPGRRQALVTRARAFQQVRFGPDAMAAAVSGMIEAAS